MIGWKVFLIKEMGCKIVSMIGSLVDTIWDLCRSVTNSFNRGAEVIIYSVYDSLAKTLRNGGKL